MSNLTWNEFFQIVGFSLFSINATENQKFKKNVRYSHSAFFYFLMRQIRWTLLKIL